MSFNKRARTYRTPASDLFASGRWLPPYRAALAHGIPERELYERYRRGEIRRRSVGYGHYVYEVPVRA